MGYAVKQAMEGRKITEQEMSDMTPKDLLAEWCGWHFGDPAWAGIFLKAWDECQKMKQSA